MCRLVLMNKQGEKEINRRYGLSQYLKYLEESYGGHGNGFIAVKNKKIVFLGSEAAPFIATGGLADVLGSLPKALAQNEHLDVSVILPLYGNINKDFKEKFKFLTNFNVSVSWRLQYAGVYYYEHQGVKFYFIGKKRIWKF